MPPIIIPDVCRFTVNQRLGGQAVVNIVDMQVDTTGSEVSREDACHEIAGDILNNWTDHIMIGQREDITAENVSWFDLNSLDGSVGTRTTTSENAWPRPADGELSAVLPAIVALRVDKAVTATRGAKRGRMYLAGIGEDHTDPGVSQTWTSGRLDLWNTRLQLFLDGLNDQNVGPLPLAVQRQMVVVHAAQGSYSPVSSLTANPNIASQVRRGVLR